MSNYFTPKYYFKIVNYNQNWITPPSNLPKYLSICIDDKNKINEEDQFYSFFISLKDVYFIKEGKNIIIGNKNKEITITHYEKWQADENNYKLKKLLNIPD